MTNWFEPTPWGEGHNPSTGMFGPNVYQPPLSIGPPPSQLGGITAPPVVTVSPGGTGGALGFNPGAAAAAGMGMGRQTGPIGFNPGAAAAAGMFGTAGPVTPAAAAAGGMNAATAAAAAGGAGGLLGRIFAPGTTLKSGLGRISGYGLGGAIAGSLGERLVNNLWNNPNSTTDEGVANALQWALTGAGVGAGIGSIVPVIGTGIGAGVGGLIGGVGGWLMGRDERGGDEDSGAAMEDEELLGTFQRVLSGLGADDSYVDRAWAQFQLSQELSPDLDDTQRTALGQQVLQSAVQQLGIEQERQFYESNIAAVQAWMEPMLQQQLDSAQWYADQYATMGQAAASEISNPGLRAALEAQGAAYSAQQANANSLALQQMAFYPQTLVDQVAAAYEQQIAQLEAGQQMSAFGGLPMVPMPQTAMPALALSGTMGGRPLDAMTSPMPGVQTGEYALTPDAEIPMSGYGQETSPTILNRRYLDELTGPVPPTPLTPLDAYYLLQSQVLSPGGAYIPPGTAGPMQPVLPPGLNPYELAANAGYGGLAPQSI